MKVNLIDEKINSSTAFVINLLSSLKISRIVLIISIMILVQLIGNYFIYFVEKAPLNFVTLISMLGVFPGFLIVGLCCCVFVFKRYKNFSGLINQDSIEIFGYKKYFMRNLSVIDVYGPKVICITFDDGKVFYFISKDEFRSKMILAEIKTFSGNDNIVYHSIGR